VIFFHLSPGLAKTTQNQRFDNGGTNVERYFLCCDCLDIARLRTFSRVECPGCGSRFGIAASETVLGRIADTIHRHFMRELAKGHGGVGGIAEDDEGPASVTD
jgi:hypothetical protein